MVVGLDLFIEHFEAYTDQGLVNTTLEQIIELLENTFALKK